MPQTRMLLHLVYCEACVDSNLAVRPRTAKPYPPAEPCASQYCIRASNLSIHSTVKPRSTPIASVINVSLDLVVLDGDGRTAKVVSHQGITRISRKSCSVIHQRAPEPRALGILDGIVVLIGESEAVRGPSVLVVHNLGVGAVVPADVDGVLGVVVLVLRYGNNLSIGATFDKDDDVLPVVAMAASVDDVLYSDIFLEVVGIHVRAPIIVATAADVNVIVIQVTGVAAFVTTASVVMIESFGN